MKPKTSRRVSSTVAHPGFPIAPMVDVVFVILLFFIAHAAMLPVERAHSIVLPGSNGHGIDMPDEMVIRIEDDGEVSLNDDPVDPPGTTGLSGLENRVSTLKASADSLKSRLLVTVEAHEAARYQRVMDVMNVLGKIGVSDVTFSLSRTNHL